MHLHRCQQKKQRAQSIFSSGLSSDRNHYIKEKNHNNNYNANEQEGKLVNSNLESQGKVTEDEKKRLSTNAGGLSSQEENSTSSSLVKEEQ